MRKLLNLLGTALVLVGLSGCGGGSGDPATSNPTPGAVSWRDFAADPSLRLQSGQTAVMNLAATDAPCPTQGPCTAPGPVLIPIHLANATTLTHTIDPDVLAQTLSTLRHVELRDSSGKVIGALNPASTSLAVTLEAGDYTIALYPGFTLADEPAGSRTVFLHPQQPAKVALGAVRPVKLYSASDVKMLLSTGSCVGCDLSKANLSGASLRNANLSRANLSGALLNTANLTAATLASANLTSANLTYANLFAADLFDANLTNANLSSANLTSAMENAKSAGVNGTTLTGTIWTGVVLSGAIYTNSRICATPSIGACK